MIDLFSSATTLRAGLTRRDFSSAELVEATLARIAAANPAINAVVQLDAVGARAGAAAADARLADGTARPLEGLPITIKDAFDVAGMISTAGAPNYKDRTPLEDAAPVARLRRAGAIIIGKTNVPVFSGDFQTYNPHYGVTNNPWDATRSPGGSSGGAAAAVATGMSVFELGSDLGGSLRWPAHACGVFALKTTWNLVSTWGHVPPPQERRTPRNPELMVAGPLARSTADLGLVLDVIAGPRDAAAPCEPFASARKTSPKSLRLSVWLDESFAPADAGVNAAVRLAAQQLAEAGAIVDERARPGFSFEEAYEIFAVINHFIVGYGLPPKLRDRLAAQAANYVRGDLSHRALQARGARLTPGDYNSLNARRLVMKRRWAQFFTRYDAVLCPPAPVGAILHDHRPDFFARGLSINSQTHDYLDFLKWASLATGADLPAAVAPVMLGPDGLPRGVQIITAAFEDRTAISIAAMLEQLCGGFRAPPLAG